MTNDVTAPDALRLALLGQPEVWRAGRRLEFRTRRALALLLYLVAEPGRHSREKLTALFWPDSDAERGRASLRRTLAYLKEAVGDLDGLVAERDSLGLELAADQALDLRVLERAWQAARQSGREAPLGWLQAGAAAYRGDFLAGFSLEGSPEFDDWASIQREAWHRRMDLVFDRLTEQQAAAGDWPAAQEALGRWLAHHPLNEAAHRRLMEVCYNAGDRAGALRAFAACQAVLARELDAEPSAETQALAARIQSGAAAPPPVHPPPAAPRPTGLPAYLNTFVGRERELDEIGRLLADPANRLLTLVGPGGAGKTRLAVQAAQRVNAAAGGDVIFVPLAALGEAGQVAAAVAAAAGLTFYGPADPQAQLRHALQAGAAHQRLLLILDNLEHLLPGAGQAQLTDLLTDWLGAAPGLTLLATSREPLGVPGEWVLELTGLGDQAAQLFLQSARQARVGFAPAPADEPAITRICQLVEGLPLGLELAAAWVRTLNCGEIAAEIERELDFLAQARPGRPERHRSLRAVFDHSWALLSAAEQRALRRLAVFRGGFARAAAEAVAAAGLPVLADLAGKSLLRRLEGVEGRPRFDLHELVRRYALEQLEGAGEAAAVRDRHLAYYADWADPAAGGQAAPLYGAEQADRLADWDRELDNLRAALAWAFAPEAPAARRTHGLQLAARLDRFWQGRGHVREGCQWLQAGLARPEGVPALAQAEAYNTWGWLVNQLGEAAQARALQEQSLALYRAAGDQAGEAAALDGLGDIAWGQDDFEAAQAYYAAGLALRRALGDEHGQALALYSLGRLYVDHGQLAPAREHLLAALALLEAGPDQRGLALVRNGLGRLALRAGEPVQAAEHIGAALRRFHALGNRVDIAECLEELAVIARDSGDLVRAARIWGAAEALREASGVAAPAGYYDVIAGVLADRLGEAAQAAAWAEGRALDLDQAVAAALAPAC